MSLVSLVDCSYEFTFFASQNEKEELIRSTLADCSDIIHFSYATDQNEDTLVFSMIYSNSLNHIIIKITSDKVEPHHVLCDFGKFDDNDKLTFTRFHIKSLFKSLLLSLGDIDNNFKKLNLVQIEIVDDRTKPKDSFRVNTQKLHLNYSLFAKTVRVASEPFCFDYDNPFALFEYESVSSEKYIVKYVYVTQENNQTATADVTIYNGSSEYTIYENISYRVGRKLYKMLCSPSSPSSPNITCPDFTAVLMQHIENVQKKDEKIKKQKQKIKELGHALGNVTQSFSACIVMYNREDKLSTDIEKKNEELTNENREMSEKVKELEEELQKLTATLESIRSVFPQQ